MVSMISSGNNYKKDEYDVDYYIIEESKPPFSKDCTIYVDYFNKTISGNCIAYGMWFDLNKNECIETLLNIEKNGRLLRDYKKFI